MNRAVLVVEDEADILLLERFTLELGGYQVLGAASAEEALMVLERESIDALVLDLGLPGMDGWGLLDRLQKEGVLGRLPVIAATAHASASMEERALKAGCRACLIKPFSMEELRVTIDRLLDAG